MKVDFSHIQNGIALLIDPDKSLHLQGLLLKPLASKINFFLVGGSGELKNSIDGILEKIKSKSNIPCIIFPGAISQISDKADGIMIVSLLSGRNPEYLIGKLVQKASVIQNMKMSKIPVGYILIDGGIKTSTQIVTETQPLSPTNITEIVNTAIAGELLGMKAIYLEAGSGAIHTVNLEIIKEVRKNIQLPIIVGGGIKKYEEIKKMWQAGANMVVIGNVLEKNPEMIEEIIQTT